MVPGNQIFHICGLFQFEVECVSFFKVAEPRLAEFFRKRRAGFRNEQITASDQFVYRPDAERCHNAADILRHQQHIVHDMFRLSPETLAQLAGSCSEFLVHAVDSEGRRNGPELALVDLLAQSPIPVTYAGGIASFEDLEELRSHGQGRVDVTVGSALDLFGGNMSYQEVLDACRKS